VTLFVVRETCLAGSVKLPPEVVVEWVVRLIVVYVWALAALATSTNPKQARILIASSCGMQIVNLHNLQALIKLYETS